MKKSKENKDFIKAGFILRTAAFLLDYLVLAIVVALISALYGFKMPDRDPVLILCFIYGFIAVGIFSTTLGKKVFNLKVVTYEGVKPPWKQAFLREILGKLISAVTFWLGFLWVLVDLENQAWHDKIAKTYVVQTTEISKFKNILAFFIVLSVPLFIVFALFV